MFHFHVEPLEHRRLLSSTVFTVNSAGDDPQGPVAGVMTLRDAINALNSDASDNANSPDVINFSIAGTPAISLAANLTAIANPVTIDGSTQSGVTVQGNGLQMLVDNSTATVNNVTFTGGTVSLGANATLTVGSASNVTAAGDLTAADSSSLYNEGVVSVSGNLIGAGSVGVYNGQDPNGVMTFAATLTVGGSFTAGDNSFAYNNGTAAFNVTKDFTLGSGGYVYNGQVSTDASTLTVGGNMSVGASGGYSYLYDYGTSSLKVTGNFTILGNTTYISNGVSSTDSASMTIGGSLNLTGATGWVDNSGSSAIKVTGDLTLGVDEFVYNGLSNADAATLTVGGNFSIGDATSGANDHGFVYNQGKSTLSVTGNFTIHGDGGSYAYNGSSSADAATFAVSGSFSLGANSFFYEAGTKAFSVTNDFTLGAGSYFDDFGTMSVGGNFDPGNGSAGNNDMIGGVFIAGAGSTVTTNTATFEVLAGGNLDVLAGAALTVVSGGTLTVDGGGSVTDQGVTAVVGLLASAKHSTIVVDYAGQLSTQGAGQSNIQGTLLTWNNPPAKINFGTALSATQLDATANVSGVFTYTLADGVTPALGALLSTGSGQILNVAFTPFDTADYSGATAQVSVNVIQSRSTPVLSASTQSATYAGAPQGFPAAAVSVTGTNGLNSSNGTLSFTYNGLSSVPSAAGTYNVVVTFTPTDTADYTVGTTTTTWTINPAAPSVHPVSESTPYTGSPLAYPLAGNDVTVIGVATGPDQTPSGTFSYSYASKSLGYGPTSAPPTRAGTYTVTVTFNTSDPNYTTGATSTATLTITRAKPAINWANPSPITYSTPLGSSQLDATANVPGSFVYSLPAGTILQPGTQTLAVKFIPTDSADYAAATATVKLVVLGPGTTVIGSQLYFVSGSTSNGSVHVSPAGNSSTGSTGVRINGVAYSLPLTSINVLLPGSGNYNVQFAQSLTLNTVIVAGNGNDSIQLGNGNNTIALGSGNDSVQAGNGTNTLVAGNGNDHVQFGNGSNNSVTLGSGNDRVQIGSGGNSLVTLGNGNDNVQIGNGSFDLVTIGTGNDTVQIGDGSNNTVILPVTGNKHVKVKFGNGINNTITQGVAAHRASRH